MLLKACCSCERFEQQRSRANNAHSESQSATDSDCGCWLRRVDEWRKTRVWPTVARCAPSAPVSKACRSRWLKAKSPDHVQALCVASRLSLIGLGIPIHNSKLREEWNAGHGGSFQFILSLSRDATDRHGREAREAQCSGSCGRYVNDAAPYEGTSVRDANSCALAVLSIRNANATAKG